MNKEDIIRMAREAAQGMEGFTPKVKDPSGAVLEFYERFAALVAKHTLANIDPNSFMSWQEGYEAGKQTEREACIDLVAMYGGPVDLEAAIRARGQA